LLVAYFYIAIDLRAAVGILLVVAMRVTVRSVSKRYSRVSSISLIGKSFYKIKLNVIAGKPCIRTHA